MKNTFDRTEEFGCKVQWKCMLVNEKFVIPERQTVSQDASH